jgi:Spy/CpxP family protein refolding chaperone
MKTTRLSLICLMLALALGPAQAAPHGQAGDPQTRARLRERISDLYLLRLTRALDLTEAQTARLYPVLTRVEKEKAGLQRDMGLDLRDLRAELAKPRPGEAEVLGLVGRIRRARRAIRGLDEEVEAALDETLTPVQKGRYLVFTVDFLRSVGENMGRVRRGGPGFVERNP